MVNICYQGPGTTDNPRFLGCDVDPTPGSTGTGKGVVFYTGMTLPRGHATVMQIAPHSKLQVLWLLEI